MFVLLILALLISSAGALRSPGVVVARKFGLTMQSNEYSELLEGVRRTTPPGSIVVIKYGGHAMENDELKKLFCEDIGELCRTGVLPVIVHGGGPQIQKMLTSLAIESKFIQGLRVTDPKTMEVAQMVLCGSINKDIVGMISMQSGVRGAVGLCGLDGKLIQAKPLVKKMIDEKGKEVAVDLGLMHLFHNSHHLLTYSFTQSLVGDPTMINTKMILDLLSINMIPVIAPVGLNEQGGGSLNINADTAAGAVAEAIKANRLLLLTDIVGVLDKDKQLIESIQSTRLHELVSDGTISGGMIPKLETATQAVEAGVGAVSIMDGRVRHCILKALSGEVFGTQIFKG